MKWRDVSTLSVMLDLKTNPRLRRLFWIAHYRVTIGFVVGAVAFWLSAPTRSSLALGALLAACGEAVRVWAAGHLRKGEEVTRSGPYRFARHPLYMGSFVIGVGFAVAAADVVVAVLVLGYLSVTLWAAIRFEEATLRSAFGDEFERSDSDTGSASARRFSLSRMIQNGEHRSLQGFAAALLLLVMKALF